MQNESENPKLQLHKIIDELENINLLWYLVKLIPKLAEKWQ